MKNLLFSISIFLLSFSVSAQKALKSDALFSDQTPVEIKLGYSNKAMNKDTNDSTFIDTTMEFLNEGKSGYLYESQKEGALSEKIILFMNNL